MKLALAGSGDVGRYLYEGFKTYGHEVLILGRTPKDWIPEEDFRLTDFSIAQLTQILDKQEALVSVINNATKANVGVHLNLLEACRRSTTCKRFISSEWVMNIEDYPDQPMYAYESREPIREALRAEENIRWTLVCVGWFMDYLITPKPTYFRDLGDGWSMNHNTKFVTLYGPGNQQVTLTAARDVAKAVAIFLEHEGDWEPYLFLSGEDISYRHIFKSAHARDPEWKSRTKTLTASIEQKFKYGSE